MTYYQLLKKPAEDLTEDEKKQLDRASSIPPTARITLEARVTELRNKMREIEQEVDEINDFLNGYEYESKIPF